MAIGMVILASIGTTWTASLQPAAPVPMPD